VETWRPPLWYERLSAVSWRFLVIFIAIATILGVIFSVGAVVLPAFLALLMASVLQPMSELLRRRGLRPGLAAGLTVLVLSIAIAAIIWLTVRVVVDQWTSISADLSKAVDELQESASSNLDVDSGTTHAIASDIRDAVGKLSDLLVSGLTTLIPTAASVLSTLALSILVTFFYLKDGASMWAWIISFTGTDAEGTIDRVGRQSFAAIAAFMRSQTLIAAIDGSAIGLGAWALGVPAPGAIALLTFAMAYIPYIGAFIAGTVAVLLAVSEGGVSLGAWMLGIVIAVQLIEGNVLQPVIQSRGMRIHPLVVVLAMVAGGAIGGFIGMLVAVPLTGAAVAAITELRRDGILGAAVSVHVEVDRRATAPPGEQRSAPQ
jgi:predicted PurR-regulated permease PerM